MKWTCEKLAQRLPAYLDGSLEIREETAFEEHLAACEKCRERLLEFRETWTLLEHYPRQEPSPGFAASVMREVHVQRKADRIRWYRRTAAALAACLLLGACLLFGLSPGSGTGGALDGGLPLAEAELLENLDLIEDLDFLMEVGEDLELAMEYDLFEILSERENL